MYKAILWVLFFVIGAIGIRVEYLYQADMPMNVLKKKYAPKPSKFVKIKSMPIHYRDEGQGPVVILLHGTASSLHTWEDWAEELAKDHRVITVDLPGFGLTGPHYEADYSIDAYNEFINLFVERLKIDKFSIGGNSLGGYISWNYTLDYQDRVQSLILVNASGFPTDPVMIFKLFKNPIIGPILTKIAMRSMVQDNVEEVYYDDDKISNELIDRYFELSLRQGNRQALRDRIMRQEESRISKLGSIEVPTLILWGDHDEWIPLEHANLFKERIPHAELHIVEAGHVPMEELPQETAFIAHQFLTTNQNIDN